MHVWVSLLVFVRMWKPGVSAVSYSIHLHWTWGSTLLDWLAVSVTWGLTGRHRFSHRCWDAAKDLTGCLVSKEADSANPSQYTFYIRIFPLCLLQAPFEGWDRSSCLSPPFFPSLLDRLMYLRLSSSSVHRYCYLPFLSARIRTMSHYLQCV